MSFGAALAGSPESFMNDVNAIGFDCPSHLARLEAEGEFLYCPEGERFPIKDGIPRFVKETSYADAFGAQWKKFRRTQLDSYSGVPITQERIRRCLGEDLWNELSGKHVLECGCGAGRFTEVLLARGARVTSVDLSVAVEANQENFPQTSAHRIAQADILNLPFRQAQFDTVFCLGVIQHTPDPEETIAALARQVKPSGTLVIDHYTYKLSEFTKTAALLRFVLKRVSPEAGLNYTDFLVKLFLPLHKRVRHFRLAQMILSRFSPVLCYYRAYPQLSDAMQYQWALLDTHDSLTCWYRRFRTRYQIERTLIALDLRGVFCVYGGNGVEARGMRGIGEVLSDSK